MKNIAILGSTGSIGQQALEVIANNRDRFSVEVLTANNNFELLIHILFTIELVKPVFIDFHVVPLFVDKKIP